MLRIPESEISAVLLLVTEAFFFFGDCLVKKMKSAYNARICVAQNNGAAKEKEWGSNK